MSTRDDRINAWIRDEAEKAQRKTEVVPPSSQQVHGEPPSSGEQALVAISQWMADTEEVPIVELAVMSPEAVLLTFAEPVDLPEPFYSADEDAPAHSDSWQINVDDTLTLEGSDHLGSQMMALVGIGTTTAGAQAFVNTTRWGAFGIAGTPEWTQRALLSQAMVQAAQLWSQDQQIWLVGMDETADKLIHLMRDYHPEENFHTAETVEAINPAEIGEASATIYVAQSEPATYVRFKALQLPNAGLITDSVVNQEAMFMSEADDGSVVIAPTDHVLYPNVVDDILEMLDLTWDQAQRLDDQAIEEAAGADYDALLKEPTPKAVSTDQDVDAAFAEIIGNANLTAEAGPAEEPPQTEHEDTATEDHPEEHAETTISQQLTEPPRLHLLGKAQVTTEASELQGRNAETAALLQLNDGQLNVQDISAAIWPNDEPEGRAARTRRSRLLTSIRTALEITTEPEGHWSVEPLPTDLSLILQALEAAGEAPEPETLSACHHIEPPLQDAGQWAQPHRQQITAQLHEALTAVEQNPQTPRRITQAATSARERLEKN